jgi:hypothetical protein
MRFHSGFSFLQLTFYFNFFKLLSRFLLIVANNFRSFCSFIITRFCQFHRYSSYLWHFLILRFQLLFLKSFGIILSDCPISIVLLTCGIDVSKKFKVDLVYLSSQTFCLLSVHPQVSWDIASRRQQHPSVALFVEMRLHILVKHQHIVWDTANVYRLSGLSCFLPAPWLMTFENFWL